MNIRAKIFGRRVVRGAGAVGQEAEGRQGRRARQHRRARESRQRRQPRRGPPPALGEEVRVTHGDDDERCRADQRLGRRRDGQRPTSSQCCGTGSSFTSARTARSNARSAGSATAASASNSRTKPGSIARADEQADVLREVIRRSFPDVEFEARIIAAGTEHDGPEGRRANAATARSGRACFITIIRAPRCGSATSPRPAR